MVDPDKEKKDLITTIQDKLYRRDSLSIDQMRFRNKARCE